MPEQRRHKGAERRAVGRALALAALAVWLAASSGAQEPSSPRGSDTPELGSVEAIARDTTDPRFSSPWVAYVPESATVPSPTDFLGRIAGAAGELARSEQIYGYFRALAEASPRVRLETIGRSLEGRDIVLAIIADEAGIAALDRLKAATAALADPRRTSPEQAEELIAGARPIYYFNAALHADESGSPEAMMELAYRLAVSETEQARRIRERVLVLINPVSNPDGRDKMVDWFYRHLKGRTDFAALPRISPPYWNHYVFVDANRDAHQLSQEETRAVARMFFEYHPTVIHDLHEAIALLLTWNGTGPYNPNIDPITFAELLQMSFHEVTTLTALGMPGVWTWDFGEGFGHHYLDSIAMNHNAIGRGYETWGNGTAETVRHLLDDDQTTREWYRPWPPPREFRWSARDNVNYTQTAALAILDWTARHGRELLRAFYRKGWSSWRRGLEQPPHAFVIPAEQGDRRRVAQMVSQLGRQGIDVHRAARELDLGGQTWPAGSFVVRLDQPYRNYAVDLLLPQEFPEDTEQTPYDDVSWALPVHYGLEAVPVADPAVLELPLEAVGDEVASPIGRVIGDGPVYLLRDTGQEGLLEARYLLASYSVETAEHAFVAGGVEYPRGSWALPPEQPGLRAALEEVARDLLLDFSSAPMMPDVPLRNANPPRLGVWVPWADTDSIGWVRWVLDQRGVPYAYLRDEDVRAGGLRAQVDAILYGQVDLELQSQIHGLEPVTGPLAFSRTEEYPSHGTPATSEDITGGIGFSGLAELERFVEEGGTLVTLGNGSTLVLEAGLVRFVRPARGVAVHTPGVELRARFADPDHPLAYGYPQGTSFFRGLFTVYDTPRRWLRMAYCTGCLDGPVDHRHVAATWGDPEAAAPMVVSGGARNEQQLVGRPAILVVPKGRGRYVVFNFNPLHRDLNRSDFRLVWNALLYWDDLPEQIETED